VVTQFQAGADQDRLSLPSLMRASTSANQT
jgi:hypothetical protein